MIFEGIIAKGQIPDFIQNLRRPYIGKDLQKLIDQYFKNNELIETYFKERDFNNLNQRIQFNLAFIEPLIEYWTKIDGEFMQLTIPAIEKGLIVYPLFLYIGQMKNIQEIVEIFSELNYYNEDIENSNNRIKIVKHINSEIKKTDLTLKKVQKEIIDIDNRMVTETTKYMEKFNLIKRDKLGSDYKLLEVLN